MLPMMLYSQSDFESWSSIDLRYNVSNKLSLEMSNELRLNNNSQNFKKFLVDLGASYELHDLVEVALYYRYSRFDDLEFFANEHLIIGKLAFAYKIDRFNLGFQTRYDRAYEVYGYKTLVKTEDAWRNKVSVDYSIYGTPLEPYLSFEHFITENKESFEANKYRLFGGLKYKMNRKNSFAIFYGTQQSLLKPDNSYIIGLKYGFRFN